MKRALSLVLSLALLCAPALCRALEGDPITGSLCFPEGADEAGARYLLRYCLPAPPEQTDIDRQIAQSLSQFENALLVSLATALSERAAQAIPDEAQGFVTVDHQLTVDSEAYYGVLLTVTDGDGLTESSESISLVYARTGVNAGSRLTLRMAAGLETEAEERGIQDTAYALLWDILTQPGEDFTVEYFPDLTREELTSVFQPETDFYLDMDGNIVFFIQSGRVASEVYGMLTFPFSRAELLSAMKDE